MSYHLDPVDTVRNGATLIRAGAQAVKLEGGANRVPMIEALVGGRDPGHGPPRPHPPVGQRHGRLPGPGPGRRRGPRPDASTPRPWSAAGCFAVVLEGVPESVGAAITESHRRAHHRHRGRAGLRRPGARLPRPARVQRHARPSSSAATPTWARRPRRRWPPTPPTCGRGPSRPTPRSTTELGTPATRPVPTGLRIAGRVRAVVAATRWRPSSSDLPHAVGLGRSSRPIQREVSRRCGHTKPWSSSTPAPTRPRSTGSSTGPSTR